MRVLDEDGAHADGEEERGLVEDAPQERAARGLKMWGRQGRGRARSMLRLIRMADKEEKIEFEGEVVESFRSGMYRIMLDNGHETLGYTSGRMRRYRIRINPGDHVKVELSPYDLSRGRIVYRNK